MQSRERVIRAIHFKNPDRAPISHAILPAAQIKYGEALTEILESVHEDFGWHFLPDMRIKDLPPMYKAGQNYDDFGTLWDVETEGICGIPVKYPFADWADYDNYIWPQFSVGPPKTRLYSGHIAGVNEEYYARGAWITFFEQMQQLRGMEQLLIDLACRSKEVYRLRDDLLAFNLRWINRWLELEYDGLHFGDDWGTQTTLMISPELWRKFFKPVYKQMFDKVKTGGLDVHFHSDGQILDIMPDLLDLGIDVINCQTSLMGLEKIRKNFTGKVCFRTDLDRQKIIPFGTPEQVKNHILDVFDSNGTPDGGIIACGEIGPDVPLKNIKAMYETFKNYFYK